MIHRIVSKTHDVIVHGRRGAASKFRAPPETPQHPFALRGRQPVFITWEVAVLLRAHWSGSLDPVANEDGCPSSSASLGPWVALLAMKNNRASLLGLSELGEIALAPGPCAGPGRAWRIGSPLSSSSRCTDVRGGIAKTAVSHRQSFGIRKAVQHGNTNSIGNRGSLSMPLASVVRNKPRRSRGVLPPATGRLNDLRR